MTNTSAIAVAIVAVVLAATGGAVAFVAYESGYVEITVYGDSDGFGEYFEDTMDAMRASGAKDIRDVSSSFPGSAAFKCKVPSDWTFKQMDALLYQATGEYYYPLFNGPGGSGLWDTDGTVYSGLILYMMAD